MYNKFVEDYLKLSKKYLFVDYYNTSEPDFIGGFHYNLYDGDTNRTRDLFLVEKGFVESYYWLAYYHDYLAEWAVLRPFIGFLDSLRISFLNFVPWESTVNDFWAFAYFSYTRSDAETGRQALNELLWGSLAYSECLDNSIWFHLYGYVYYLYGGYNKPYIVTKPWLYQEDIFYQTIVDYIHNAKPRPIRWFFQFIHNPKYALRRLYTEGNFYTRQFIIYDRPVERLFLECWDQKQPFSAKIMYKYGFYRFILAKYKNENVSFMRYLANSYGPPVNKLLVSDKLFFNNLRNLEFTLSNYLPHHLRRDLPYIIDDKEDLKRWNDSHNVRYLRSNNNYKYTRSYARADSIFKIPFIAIFALQLLPVYMIIIFSVMVLPRTKKDAWKIRQINRKHRRNMRIYFVRFKKYFTESELLCLTNVMYLQKLRFKKFFIVICFFSLPLLCFLLF